ncbi:MAG: hypothetical protein O3A00_22090, partial [Planctomycetota bacterium]|nr:hypothetical protein [Planctomycetota bacterium]
MNRFPKQILINSLAFVVLSVPQVFAHPISMSDAVVDVLQDRIQVDLQVMIEDLVLYHGLESDGEMIYSHADILGAAEEHRKFVTTGLRILADDGTRIVGDIKSLDVGRVPKAGVAQQDVKATTVTYRLEYPVKQPPQFVTVMQQFGGEDAVLPAIMDCTLLQNGVLLDRPTPLVSGQTQSVKLDWKNPPKNPKSFRDLRRQKQERQQQRLGISSYSGLYSFIYITQF